MCCASSYGLGLANRMKAILAVLFAVLITSHASAADKVLNEKSAIEIGRKVCGDMGKGQTRWHARLRNGQWTVWSVPDDVQVNIREADGIGDECRIPACVIRD